MPITIEADVVFGSGEGFFGRLGSNPDATLLSDGRIAVTWAEYQYPGDGSVVLDYDTWTRVLNADGSIATAATMVNTTRVGAHAPSQVAALSDGGYVVTWLEMTRMTVEGDTQTVYPQDIYARSYTAAGAPEGPAVLVSPNLGGYDPSIYNSILASNVVGSNVLGLAGGGAVVIYDYRDGGGGYEDGGTYARTIGNDGQTLGTPVRVWEENVHSRDMVQLSSGDLAMVEFAGQLTGYNIRLSAADLTSAPAGVPGAAGVVTFGHDPQPDQTAGGYASGPRIAAMSDGGFAVTYGYNVALGTDGDESIRIDRFDAQGTYLSTAEIAVPDDTVQQPGAIPYEILGLSGGRILVAWSHAVAYGDTDIMAVVVNADGTFESEPTLVVNNTANYQLLGDLTLLQDGRVFMTVTDSSGVQVDGVADYMHGVFLQLPDAPPEAGLNREGTSGDDLLIGGGGNDVLNGRAGNDTLRGMDGTDTLIGGDGNDVIEGGATPADLRDVIYGGNGNDQIDGGYGNDELRGDNGNDTITGASGVDTIIGGAGDDVLTGQTWSDVILGGDGFDFINGGFGHDRVNGGADADQFYHLGVEGHGSDWVQDFSDAEGDRLVFGGSASLSDFQVNFTETANAGAAGVQEAFVIYKPSQQILWALVDGAAQEHIDIVIGGQQFDLLA